MHGRQSTVDPTNFYDQSTRLKRIKNSYVLLFVVELILGLRSRFLNFQIETISYLDRLPADLFLLALSKCLSISNSIFFQPVIQDIPV